MTDDLPTAVARLTDVLERENAALAALDLPGAARLLAEKQAAAGAFAALQQAIPSGAAPPPAVARLRSLGERNRSLLERAIAVQGAVIGVIAAALPTASHGRYAASGAPARSGPSVAFALMARA